MLYEVITRIVNIPSYTVTTTEEDSIRFTPESKFPEMLEKSKEKQVEAPVEAEESTEQKEEKTEMAPQIAERNNFV